MKDADVVVINSKPQRHARRRQLFEAVRRIGLAVDAVDDVIESLHAEPEFEKLHVIRAVLMQVQSALRGRTVISTRGGTPARRHTRDTRL